MRVLATCILALGIAASPVMAGTGTPSAAGASGSAEATAAPASSTPAAKSDPAAKPEPSSLELQSELQQLRDLIEAQSKQLQQQNDALKAEQEKTEALERQLASGAPASISSSATPAASSISATPTLSAAAVEPSAVINNTSSNSSPAKSTSSSQANPDEPASIHYKGITLTPGGYMAAESVWRQHAISGDVNTPFNSIAFPGSSQNRLTEFNASGRQSRISMLVEGKLTNVKIGGYYETDFLGTGITSNNNQSNSYVLRQRQFWGQAAFTSGLTITGGQMWSLITETRQGVNNRSEATTATIDAAYNVGFSWQRQYGLRISQAIGKKFVVAASVEQAQTLATFHGQNNNFLIGQYGVGGGLYNATANYAYNEVPDFVFKAVAEPGFGHYEVFGVVSTFRDRIFPCVIGSATIAGCGTGTAAASSTFGAYNNSRIGGGVGANARATFFKKVELGIHFLGGDGVGRYGAAGLADATVRPDGTLALIRNYQGLGTIELHPTPKLDIYLYGGGEYDARAAYVVGGKGEGYGSALFSNAGCWSEVLPGAATSTPNSVGGSAGFIPGSLANCTGDTRNIFEGTGGFWYRFYRGSRGTMQYGMQYSYVEKNTWHGVGNASGVGVTGQPAANENMVFTSLRYILP
jgi:hypothetical protein